LNDPKAFLELLASLRLVTREEAAKDQIEAAIWLWFHEEATVSCPVSVHTLAAASQGVLTSIARDKKVVPSGIAKLMKKAPQVIRNPQNFFKHGDYTGLPKQKTVSHSPDLTDMILADNIGTYRRLLRTSTPLMDLFLLRYSWSFPESKVSLKTLEIELVKRIKIEEAARLSRLRFLKVLLPLIVEITAPNRAEYAKRRLHFRKRS
jgi:hypothetical protein